MTYYNPVASREGGPDGSDRFRRRCDTDAAITGLPMSTREENLKFDDTLQRHPYIIPRS